MRTVDRRSRNVATPVALCLVVAACGGGTQTSAPGSTAASAGPTSAATRTVDQICADAAGTSLTYYQGGDPPDEAVINEGFAAAYPEIDVTHIQQFPGQQLSTVLAETQAGRAPESGIVSGNIVAMTAFLENNLVADLDYAAMGLPAELVREIGGVGIMRHFRQFGGLLYNRDATDPADLPDTWAELAADASLRGQLMSEPAGVQLGSLRLAWTQEEFESFITDLVANLDPVVVDGTSSQVAKVLTEEFVIGDAGVDGEVNQRARTGAPVGLKYLDVITTFDGYSAILDKYPNRDAAICYLAWTVSPEGKQALTDVTTKRNDDGPSGDDVPADAVIAEVRTEDDVALLNEGANFYADALEGQPVIEE